MSVAAPSRRYTPDDLLTMPEGRHYELVDGGLVELNVSLLSSVVACRTTALLTRHVDEAELGYVAGADAGFQCFPFDPGKLRRPGGSFIRLDRIAPEELERGHVHVAPDLAIEVVSPNDLASDVKEKVEEYLRAGVKLVWVIDPGTRTIDVYRPDGSNSRLRADGELTGEEVVPGFRCRVGELFPPEREALVGT